MFFFAHDRPLLGRRITILLLISSVIIFIIARILLRMLISVIIMIVIHVLLRARELTDSKQIIRNERGSSDIQNKAARQPSGEASKEASQQGG